MAGKEAGGITQHIGASEVPADVIREICKGMLSRMNANIVIPGLLFIDTPVTSVILADAQLRIERIQGIGNVNIELVWEPAWSPEMISEEARLNLQV